MIRRVAQLEAYEVPFGDDDIDWQYVEDVSSVTVRALDAERTKTRIFNTRGDVRSVVEGVKYLQKLEPLARLTLGSGKFGIAWDYDTAPLKDELGFEPQFTMEQGIQKTFSRYRTTLSKVRDSTK